MKNKTKTFSVKEESIMDFFKKYTNLVKPDSRRGDYNPYYFFKDEIIMTKNKEFEEGDNLTIELKDHTSGSQQKLINTYLYSVNYYDDVSVKLKLTHFEVTLIAPDLSKIQEMY